MILVIERKRMGVAMIPDDIAGGAEHLHGLLVGVAVQATPVHLHNLIVHLHHTRPTKDSL
jgi:hypothetical protein